MRYQRSFLMVFKKEESIFFNFNVRRLLENGWTDFNKSSIYLEGHGPVVVPYYLKFESGQY